jgi:hypothetical protein
MENWWHGSDRTEVLSEKPVLVPFYPLQIPHELAFDPTHAPAVNRLAINHYYTTIICQYYKGIKKQ